MFLIISSGFYLGCHHNKQVRLIQTDQITMVPTLTDNLIALHKRKFVWMENKNVDSLNILLHDDVQYVHSNGWKESKSDVIHNISTEKLTYHKVQVLESNAKIIDNTGIVIGKGIFQVALSDKPIEITLLYTEVYSISAKGIFLISRLACKV